MTRKALLLGTKDPAEIDRMVALLSLGFCKGIRAGHLSPAFAITRLMGAAAGEDAAAETG